MLVSQISPSPKMTLYMWYGATVDMAKAKYTIVKAQTMALRGKLSTD